MSADNPRQRPFKVWSADRAIRKGIIAGSLTDLIRKGKIKLDIHEAEGVVVVLEADGTEVDDDYFRRIEENTVVLLLKAGERWYPPGVEAIRAVPPVPSFHGDVTDSTIEDSNEERIASLLPALRQNLGAIFLLSVEELEFLADMNVQQHVVHEEDADYLIRIRDTCSRILGERREATEAMNVLQVLKQANEAFSPHKRPRKNTDDDIG